MSTPHRDSVHHHIFCSGNSDRLRRWEAAAPKKPVGAFDIVGEWRYDGMYPGDGARIIFETNGTFTLIMRYDSGAAFTNRGNWSLSGADLELKPFWTTAIGTPKRLEQHERVRWWITDWYTKGLAPFGGDSLDPDQWTLLGRVRR